VTRTDSAAPIEANPTVPRPPGPGGADPLAVIGELALFAWGWLRRMRSALYLLACLAVLTLAATIVPQQPNVAATVAAWRAGAEGPGTAVARALDAMGLFDVYGSPLFLVLLVLLFTSLTGCLIPRYRAWWRLVRRSQPPRTNNLAGHDHLARITTSLDTGRSEQAVNQVLTRRRWRLRPQDGRAPRQLAAERGLALREGASLLFHTSFYVLLVGILVGQLLGFQGQVGIVEGERWAETGIGYWSARPGRWFQDQDHRGFLIDVDQFHVDWYRDPALGGTPRLFSTDVTITRPDGTAFSDTIGGNDPLVVDGMKIHLLDWGYAPRVQIEVAGTLAWDGFVTMSPAGRGFFQGAAKAPGPDPDVGLQLTLIPTASDAADPSTWTGAPWADAPLLTWLTYRGDLGLDVSQNVNVLDRTDLVEQGAGLARVGGEFTDGDVTVRFVELRRWVGLQVSHRPTAPLLLAGGLLLLLGLVPALYAFRRRVWIEFEGTDAGTAITIAGRTFQRPHAFHLEFDALVSALAEQLPEAGIQRLTARPPDAQPPQKVPTP